MTIAVDLGRKATKPTNQPNFIYAFILTIVTHHFSEIGTRVMALYLRQNFVSAQYLENQLVDFHQILHTGRSGRVLDSRRGAAGSSLIVVTALCP